ncbi:MAG: actin-binding WH2 domain-containing protein [Chloroflexales bacterium]|nr:actin-binding WH2 domain-containing protein [Chloroflexales bacterium]
MTTTTTTISRAGESAPAQPVIERFLRDRESVWRQIAAEEHLGVLIRRMLVSSSASLAAYGAVVGIAHSVPQALASALKLPVLFLLTLAICLPTLYLFNLVWGGRLSARQVLALLMATITVTSALSVAFAPITLFFMITAQSYPFFVLLNTAILALTGTVGLSFLVEGTSFLNKQAEGGARINGGLLYAWLLLYAFVGTQLGWTLRPFFGDPGRPFVLFRALEGNFYGGVIDLISALLR